MVAKYCYNCKHRVLPVNCDICRECATSDDNRKMWEPDAEAKRAMEEETCACEMVDHPSHYNQGKYECIDVMVETFGKDAAKSFCLLNAFKYVWRTGEKNGIEDIKKAVWYLEKYLELEGENEQGCE